MDDERIRQLTEEVLAAVRRAPVEPEAVASIEGRVAALEDAVRRLQTTGPAVATASATLVAARTAPTVVRHPSLRLLDVPGGEDRCVLEPDQPCEKSGRCRTFGY